MMTDKFLAAQEIRVAVEAQGVVYRKFSPAPQNYYLWGRHYLLTTLS